MLALPTRYYTFNQPVINSVFVKLLKFSHNSVELAQFKAFVDTFHYKFTHLHTFSYILHTRGLVCTTECTIYYIILTNTHILSQLARKFEQFNKHCTQLHAFAYIWHTVTLNFDTVCTETNRNSYILHKLTPILILCALKLKQINTFCTSFLKPCT